MGRYEEEGSIVCLLRRICLTWKVLYVHARYIWSTFAHFLFSSSIGSCVSSTVSDVRDKVDEDGCRVGRRLGHAGVLLVHMYVSFHLLWLIGTWILSLILK